MSLLAVATTPPPPSAHCCSCPAPSCVPYSEYARSMVVTTQAPKELGTLRAADGAEGLKDKAAA